MADTGTESLQLGRLRPEYVYLSVKSEKSYSEARQAYLMNPCLITQKAFHAEVSAVPVISGSPSPSLWTSEHSESAQYL